MTGHLLSVAEAAAIAECTVQNIRDYIDEEHLQASKIGKVHVIRRTDFETWLTAYRSGAWDRRRKQNRQKEVAL
jgi:excisionase family DNA binding protein